MVDFERFFLLVLPPIGACVILYFLKDLEGGIRKFWQVILIIFLLVFSWRLFGLYQDYERKKEEEISSACSPLLSTYDSNKCARLKK